MMIHEVVDLFERRFQRHAVTVAEAMALIATALTRQGRNPSVQSSGTDILVLLRGRERESFTLVYLCVCVDLTCFLQSWLQFGLL